MSREAFEAALNSLPAQKRWATPKQLAWEAWQAARAAALEEAAEVCMDKENIRPRPGLGERTASYCNQRAADCAQAIRALKDHPND